MNNFGNGNILSLDQMPQWVTPAAYFAKRVPAFKREISKETRAWVLERNGYTCQMCGVAAGDPDPLGGPRTVRLTMGQIKDKSKGGDDSPQNLRAVCTNCNEGLQNSALPKPDRIHLLAQIRRATIDDQQAVLKWLHAKFGIVGQGRLKSGN